MNKTEEKLFIESVFDEFSLNVKAMAKYILKDEDLAEKAVYRTFVKIIMNMKLFDDVESEDFRRLVVVFLRCSCYEILRKKRRIEYGQKFETPETYNNYGTWNKILKKSTLRWLKNTFTLFGSPFKEICILRFYYNMDIKYIARALTMNRWDVLAVLSRRLVQLRNETESFVGESVSNAEMGLAISLVSGEFVEEEFSRMNKFDVTRVKVASKTKEKILNKLKFVRAKPFVLLGLAAFLVLVSVIVILTVL